MDAEPADQDLLLLSLNLSDSEPDEAANPANNTSGSAPTTEYHPTRAERTAHSEEANQALKKTYRPKIENGNVQFMSPHYPPTLPSYPLLVLLPLCLPSLLVLLFIYLPAHSRPSLPFQYPQPHPPILIYPLQ
jgi:hypothetical protein